MSGERHVKLVRHGRCQVARIPCAFELPGNEAIIRKEGKRLVIEPVSSFSLLATLAHLSTY